MPFVKFTTVGTFWWTPPQGVTSVNYLVVGGGGGGGRQAAGGGGAGAVVTSTLPVTPGVSVKVTVGDGGPGSTNSSNKGTNG